MLADPLWLRPTPLNTLLQLDNYKNYYYSTHNTKNNTLMFLIEKKKKLLLFLQIDFDFLGQC